ncbi:Nucleoid occlusion factor SlmA [Actibacterium lipolyticum]|uniref:Nucleoid occlusion factor SlmA n=2 Tax=Actibacterium lipolyticum TaxID=1524263 RepID=A0A238KTQ8_9RHOB|nr:Nucleoid occlusion factor SlmA [Actibacterium lipolyticum]
MAAFNTNLIAERAGVSIGSLYQYFPAKEAILAELIRNMRGQLLEDLRTAAIDVEGMALEDATEVMIRASILHHARRPELARVLEIAETVLPLEKEAQALKREINATVVEVLSRYYVSNPEEAAQDLSAMTRAMVEVAANAGETDFDAVLARVCRAAFGYLGIAPHAP